MPRYSNAAAALHARTSKKPAKNGLLRAGVAGVFAVALVGVGTMPAYAEGVTEDPIAFAVRTQPQTLTTVESIKPGKPQASIEAVLKELPPPPEPETDSDADAEGANNNGGAEGATNNNAGGQSAAQQTSAAQNVPVGQRSAALVRAMFAQIGIHQDCTDAVQNGLAAIGLTERRDQGGYDLGPMSFGRFGTRIDPSQARPGDIMMSPGHVAVYTGNGKRHSAVHGGWGPTSTTAHYVGNLSSPYNFSVIIRLN